MNTDNLMLPREWIWLAEEAPDMEELPESTRELIDLIGYAATLRLIAYYGGTSLYVPKYESAFRRIRERRVLGDFDGCNHKSLARRYGLSETTVRSIVGARNEED